MVCLIEKEEGALIFDDTILEKAWTDKSELMCWHYDHVSGRSAKGVNFLNALHHVGEHLIAVAFERVIKSIEYCDTKIRQIKRMSTITKNEQMRQMMGARIQNEFKFGFVLINSWFCAEENFEFIPDRGKHFIAALKDNGRVALSEEDRKGKRLVREDELHFAQQGVVKGYLKGYDKAVSVVRWFLRTKTPARPYCAWYAATRLATMTQSLQRTKNGGKWRSFTNRSNPMPT